MSLAFVRGIHRCLVNSLHRGPVTWKMFSFDDFIMITNAHPIRDAITLWQCISLADHKPRISPALTPFPHYYPYVHSLLAGRFQDSKILPMSFRIVLLALHKEITWLSSANEETLRDMGKWITCNHEELITTKKHNKTMLIIYGIYSAYNWYLFPHIKITSTHVQVSLEYTSGPI